VAAQVSTNLQEQLFMHLTMQGQPADLWRIATSSRMRSYTILHFLRLRKRAVSMRRRMSHYQIAQCPPDDKTQIGKEIKQTGGSCSSKHFNVQSLRRIRSFLHHTLNTWGMQPGLRRNTPESLRGQDNRQGKELKGSGENGANDASFVGVFCRVGRGSIS
jgi:hypothetical protein